MCEAPASVRSSRSIRNMRRYAGASRVCVQSSGKWSCRAGTSSCVIVGIESELRDGAGDAPIIGAQELEKRKESRERGAGPSPSMSTGHLAKDEVKKLRSENPQKDPKRRSGLVGGLTGPTITHCRSWQRKGRPRASSGGGKSSGGRVWVAHEERRARPSGDKSRINDIQVDDARRSQTGVGEGG